MDMDHKWTDKSLAQTWSANPSRRNPVRSEQLDLLITLIADLYQPGSGILDLGFASGLIEEMIFQRVPEAYIVGVDSSPAMMELAQERLQPYADQYTAIYEDFSKLSSITLPDKPYQIVFASQALHHLQAEEQRQIYREIADILEPDGVFVLVDRIKVDTPHLFDLYQGVWQRMSQLSSSEGLIEGATYEEHHQQVNARGDFPSSLDDHLMWLREAGFEAACLHLHGNRALIAARKVAHS
jgi:tRNA (cmo5U34)-methyltransferase